jgi:lysophospholipase L1-like esterase
MTKRIKKGLFGIIIILLLMSTKNILAISDKKDTYGNTMKKENIVFLGDSIVDWYPIDEIFGNMPIVKSGIAGYKTTDILSRMDEMVYQYNPTQVYLLIGTNDLNMEDMDKDNVVKNIQKIFKEIKKHRKNTKLYYQSIYPVNENAPNSSAQNRSNEDIKYVNLKMKEFCDENNIVYIDMYDELADDDGNYDLEYSKDGLHPNNLGYARISRVLLKYMYNIDKE